MRNMQRQKNMQGFSIVEFIVVLVIFSTMSSISLFNYNKHRNLLEEINVTQDVALSIRQAQVYGISASNRNEGGINFNSDEFSLVDITQNKTVVGVVINTDNNSLTLFEDLSSSFNFVYNDDIDRMIDIRKVQTNRVNIIGVDLCENSANCGNIETGNIHISFQRPYSDAYIYHNGTRYKFASILIGNVSDYNRYVEVNAIGNITVKKDYD